MMEETVVITMQMDGTHTAKNANAKIPMLKLQIVLISGHLRDAIRRKTKETVEKQLLLGIARQHVNFVDVLIFGHPKNVRRIRRNVTNPIRLLSFARKLVINAKNGIFNS